MSRAQELRDAAIDALVSRERPPRNDYARMKADQYSEDVNLNAQAELPRPTDGPGYHEEVDRRIVAALEAIALELRAARWDREGVMETDEHGYRLDDPRRPRPRPSR